VLVRVAAGAFSLKQMLCGAFKAETYADRRFRFASVRALEGGVPFMPSKQKYISKKHKYACSVFFTKTIIKQNQTTVQGRRCVAF